LNLWEDAQFTFASQQATLSVPHLSCLWLLLERFSSQC
jgi:hypothetical protein